ncbi:MAG TPA: guanylate kinase [Lactobacillus sp.]|nr:guanylate kinase [Lactobacillus sp.]
MIFLKTLDGNLFIICGAPGSGKTTVQTYLTKNLGFTKVVTHTTRPKRHGEQDGSDYYFETKETFFDKHYLEYVTYDDNYYGSSFEGLERALNQTKRAVIVLDTQGVLTYLDKLPAKLLTVIFLELPSKAVQVERLYARGDKKAKIKQRLASKEAKRDAKLPAQLRAKANVLQNAELQQTYVKLEQLVADVLA